MPFPDHSPMRRPDQGAWRHIQCLGVKPGITSALEYAEAVAEGLFDARRYVNRRLDAHDQPFAQGVALQEICLMHYLILNRAHHWAGHIRAPSQSVITLGVVAADPIMIPSEIDRANRQLVAHLNHRDFDNLHAYLFHHARLMRIHPMRDGNKRTMREILVTQLRQVFPEETAFRLIWKDTERYVGALSISYHGDFNPLVHLACEEMGITAPSGDFRVPISEMTPRYYEG